MKFANTNQLGQVVGVASAVKNIQERLAREGPVCAGQAGAGHSSPHPVLHAKVLHLISSLVSPGSLLPRSPALELCGSYSYSCPRTPGSGQPHSMAG